MPKAKRKSKYTQTPIKGYKGMYVLRKKSDIKKPNPNLNSAAGLWTDMFG